MRIPLSDEDLGTVTHLSDMMCFHPNYMYPTSYRDSDNIFSINMSFKDFKSRFPVECFGNIKLRKL